MIPIRVDARRVSAAAADPVPDSDPDRVFIALYGQTLTTQRKFCVENRRPIYFIKVLLVNITTHVALAGTFSRNTHWIISLFDTAIQTTPGVSMPS